MEPQSIRNYKAREELAQRHASEARVSGRTALQASWAEALADKTGNAKQETADNATMDEDLRLAASQLTRVRRERLREQYLAEMAAWQRALGERGLAFDPDRRG